MNYIAILVKTERKKAKITQAQMAAKLGIDLRTYCKVEKGKFSIRQLIFLLDLFGYD